MNLTTTATAYLTGPFITSARDAQSTVVAGLASLWMVLAAVCVAGAGRQGIRAGPDVTAESGTDDRAMRSWLPVACGLLMYVACVPSAGAVVTGSTMLTPADGLSVFWDEANGAAAPSMQISGTVTGAVPGDKVDIRCYRTGTSSSKEIADVPVVFGGLFGPRFATTVTGPTFAWPACVLRAVPSGVNLPTDLTAFAGNRLFLTTAQLYHAQGNPGPVDFRVQAVAPDHTGEVDAFSLGYGGLRGLRPLDPLHPEASGETLNEGATLREVPISTIGRAGLRVDGHDAYAPAALDASDSALDVLPGFGSLGYAGGVDPVTGVVDVHETDPFRTCPADPPGSPRATAGDSNYCGDHLIDAHVVDDRRIVSSAGNRVVTITDRFSSTDGVSHHINAYFDTAASGSSGAWRTAWTADGFVSHGVGDVTEGPGQGRAASAVFEPQANVDNDPAFPIAAVTWPMAPDRLHWDTTGDVDAEFDRVVPASGELVIHHFYSTSFSVAEATTMADGQAPPELAIAGPADHASTDTATVAVSGVATDNLGIAALTINGNAVTPKQDGSFSSPISLHAGQNTVTVAATDHAGQTTSKAVTVTYTPPAITPPSVTPPATTPPVTTPPVSVPPTAGTVSARLLTTKARLHGRHITLKLACPKTANAGCRGRLTLTGATAKGYTLNAGQTQRRSLTVTANLAQTIRAHGKRGISRIARTNPHAPPHHLTIYP